MEYLTESFIDYLKKGLTNLSKSKTGMIICSLDTPSQKNHELLQKYLPELQKTLEQVLKNLDNISPQAQQLKKEMDNLYQEKNNQIKLKEQMIIRANDLEKEIILFEREIKGFANEQDRLHGLINDVEERVNSNRNKYEKLKPQLWIPFYGFKVAADMDKIEKEIIPALYRERDQYIEQSNSISHKRKDYEINHQPNYSLFKEFKKKIEIFEKEIEKYDQKIKPIHEQISQSIKEVAYLSILKERLNASIITGTSIDKVMEMLDKSPKFIHYGNDEMFFEMLKKWDESHDVNVFKNYIMESEKEFFK